MKRPQIVLADDHELLLAAFDHLLSSDCDVVAKVHDGASAITAARTLRPDVVVLDISMPGITGLETARQIKGFMHEIKVLFLTMHEDRELAAEAFRVGASGYLVKRSAGSELLTAIRAIVEGGSYITPLVASGLVGTLFGSVSGKPVTELRPRQRELLRLLAFGRSMKEVAAALDITPRTVAFHKYRLMKQLNIRSNAELVKYAVKHHLV